jgi:acyl-CoA synthetase (AMP-forming)/AMP-acid ligase II
MVEKQVPIILKTLPSRIGDVVQLWAERSPDKPALVEGANTWTYSQLAFAIARTQEWLTKSGIRAGDRVLIVCENCRAFVAVFLAVTALDALPVLVNARLSAREIDEIRDHCGARRLIYTTSVSPHAREHAKRHGAQIVSLEDLDPLGIGPLNENVTPEQIESDVPNRVAALIYTSGTTGNPKGVMLTHKNLLFMAAISARIRSLTTEDRLYGVLPMSHAVGLSVVLLGALLNGATIYLTSRFDPVVALAALERDRLTVLLGAPAMFALLLEYTKLKEIRTLTFPALRNISSAGAPLHAALKSEVEKLFGMVLHNGYGVTECSPTIAQTRPEAPRSDLSIGPAFPGVEVSLMGRDGDPAPSGDVGELWVRGPNVMKGYYHAPKETAGVINAEGWFNTRDLARLEDGNLFIVGRTKELIVRFGFNVYPGEVETVLNTCPGVARSGVIGRTVEGDGNEEILAFVQVSPGSSTSAAEVAAHAARHLAPYKQPSQIFLVPALPLTPTGKIVKRELEKMATDRAHAH